MMTMAMMTMSSCSWQTERRQRDDNGDDDDDGGLMGLLSFQLATLVRVQVLGLCGTQKGDREMK